MYTMNSYLSQEACEVIEYYIRVYQENALRERILDRAAAYLADESRYHSVNVRSIANEALDDLIKSGKVEVIPYSEMTFDQKFSVRFSGTGYLRFTNAVN